MAFAGLAIGRWAAFFGGLPRYAVLLAVLSALAACQTTHPDWGKGPVSLSPGVQQGFNRYMKSPLGMAFAVTIDGRQGGFVYCTAGHALDCGDGYEAALDQCRRLAKGRIACKILADLHEVVWQGPVKMATTAQMMLLARSEEATFCYDDATKSHYAVSGNCMADDQPSSRADFAAGLKRELPVYCRKHDTPLYYQGKGGCVPGDAMASKAEFERNRRFCRSRGDKRFYETIGTCRAGDITVPRDEFLNATADSIR